MLHETKVGDAARRALAVAALLLVAGVQAALAGEPAIRREGDIIHVSGFISRDAADGFRAALATPARAVHLESPGGDVDAAIAMAGAIRDAGLPVVVTGLCLSSCANYLFAAGRTRTIQPGGLVCVHGGVPRDLAEARAGLPPGPNRDAMAAHILAGTAAMLGRQRGLYASLGVDEGFIYRSEAMRVTDRVAARLAAIRASGERPSMFWCPSADYLERHGLTVARPAWYPGSEAELERLADAQGPHLVLVGEFP